MLELVGWKLSIKQRETLSSKKVVFLYLKTYRTEHLNTSGITSHGTDSFRIKPTTPGHPIPKILTHLTIFWRVYLKDRVCENNPQTREDSIRREIRRIPQEKLNRVADNFNVRVAAVLSYSSTVYGTNILLITEKV